MKKKKIIIISTIVMLVLIGIISLIVFIATDMKKEEEQRNKEMQEIKNSYEEFNQTATSFNEKKQEYDALFVNLFYDLLPSQESVFRTTLSEYTNILETMKKIKTDVEAKCQKEYYDTGTERSCNSVKVSFQSANEVFQSDLKKYNDLVTSYNEWAKENSGFREISLFVMEDSHE